MDNFTDMTVFARVVDLGGFSVAARDLGISKAAASKRVSRLEDRLHARLLNRTTRRISLTEVGRAFHERCLRILAEIDEAERAVTSMQVEPRGTLRINAPVSFGILYLGPVIADFMNIYPEVTVSMELNDRFVDVVDEGYDVAIRIGQLEDSSLIARRVAPFRTVMAASPRYWEQAPPLQVPDDLKRHRCLVYSLLPQPDRWLVHDAADAAHEVRVAPILSTNNGDVIRAALVADAGVAISPDFILGQAIRDGLLVSPENIRVVQRPGAGVYAVYPHNRHLSAKVRAFVDHLAGAFQPHPPWETG